MLRSTVSARAHYARAYLNNYYWCVLFWFPYSLISSLLFFVPTYYYIMFIIVCSAENLNLVWSIGQKCFHCAILFFVFFFLNLIGLLIRAIWRDVFRFKRYFINRFNARPFLFKNRLNYSSIYRVYEGFQSTRLTPAAVVFSILLWAFYAFHNYFRFDFRSIINSLRNFVLKLLT